MTGSNVDRGARWSRWRLAGWGAAALLLLMPFAAMQLTDEVDWSPGDFLIFGVLIALAGAAIELGARVSRNPYSRAGFWVAAATAFLLILVNLAVGFLGSEDNPANLMFGGVLGVAIVGAAAARGSPSRLARVMVATAAAQALAGAIGLFGGFASPGGQGVYEVLLGTSLFGALWLLSAWLFSRAAASGAAPAS